jgi:hypothetical protein
MIKQITKEQCWQVTGLLALAKNMVRQAGEIKDSPRFLFEVGIDETGSGKGDPQHIEDAVWSGYSTEELLDKLGVTMASVSATPAPEPKKRAAPKCSNCQQEGHRKSYCPGIIKGAA